MRSHQLFGIQFSNSPSHMRWLEERYIDKIIKETTIEEHGIPDARWFRELMSNSDLKHYAISASISLLCQKLKIQQPLNFDWMAQLKDGKRQYNLGRTFIRFNKTGKLIHGISCTTDEDGIKGDVTYAGFRIDLEGDEVVTSSTQDYAQAAVELFYRLYSFIELAEIQETIVPPKGKIGSRKKEPFKNDETIPISYVTSTWATTIYVQGQIPVSAHFRMQPYGPGKSLRKLILIHPFTKMGYTVRAGKLIEEGTQND